MFGAPLQRSWARNHWASKRVEFRMEVTFTGSADLLRKGAPLIDHHYGDGEVCSLVEAEAVGYSSANRGRSRRWREHHAHDDAGATRYVGGNADADAWNAFFLKSRSFRLVNVRTTSD